MTTITFEKHLPQLFLEQLECNERGQPFTLTVPVAVMMTDISGFSTLAVALTRDGAQGAETLREILNDYFGSLGAIVAQAGGDITTFAGDAVIAVWPASGQIGRAVHRAAQCALDIQRQAPGWSKGKDLKLTQRIAVSCGNALMAKLGGSGGKWLNVFAGQAIVDAGRACDVTTPGEVLMTADAWQLLPGTASLSMAAGDYKRLDGLASAPAVLPRHRALSSALAGEELANYVPDVLVRRAGAGQDEWLEEFRLVTVMFVKIDDIDFTSPSCPDDLQRMTCAIQDIVLPFGGAIPYVQMDDKGLNYIIAFGIPTAAYEDDAARSLDTGLQIQAALRRIDIRPSIGIATGTLYCGECGADDRTQYSMIGPAINFAARLAGVTADDLLCDEQTGKAAGDKFGFTVAHQVRPKHLDTTVRALRPHPHEQATSTHQQTSPMVGRAAQLQQLLDALEPSQGTDGARLLVTGEPGIGKSRLLSELKTRAEQAGLTVIGGDAASIEHNTLYFVWREILGTLLTALSNPGESSQETLRRQLADEAQLLQWAPLLNDVMPIGLEHTALTGEIRGTARAASIQALLLSLVRRAGASNPVVLVVDDLQWVDELSGQALLTLAERLPALSLVVGTRPLEDESGDVVARFAGLPIQRTLALDALNESQTGDVVSRTCDGASVPAQLRQLIYQRSEGNPFYIEQLSLELLEAGHIEIEDGKCALRADMETQVAHTIPDTLRGLIASRVDRLGDTEQLILKLACVFGRIFPRAGLNAIFPRDTSGQNMIGLLDRLLASKLILRDAPDPAVDGGASIDTTNYAFTHGIVQEAIYELLPRAQRKRVHHRIADWLEERHSEAMAGYFGVLARHCMLADEFSRAINHLEGGAVTAIRNSAYREAISHVHTAQRISSEQQLKSDANRRAHWHSLLGDSYHELSEYHQARDEYLRALSVLDRPYAPGGLARTAGIIANLAAQMTLRKPTRPASPIAARTDSLASHAYAQLSEISYHENNPLTVLHLTLLSVKHAERAQSMADLSAGYGAIAIAFGQMGLAGVARRYSQRATALAESRPEDIHAIAYAHLLAIVNASSQCDWEVLDHSGNRAQALYAELGEPFRLAGLHALQANGAIQRARYGAADAILANMGAAIAPDTPSRVIGWHLSSKLLLATTRNAVDVADVEMLTQVADDMDSLVDRLMALGSAASAWLRLGRHERALSTSRQGLELLLDRTPVAAAGYIYGPLGVVEALLACWHQVEPTQRAAHAQQCLKACAKLKTYTQQVPSTRPRGYFLLGCHAELTGSPRPAGRLWRKAVAAAEALSMPYEKAVALRALGQRSDAGNNATAQAQQIFTSIQAPAPQLFEPSSSH